jgi:hypothetical protein
MEKLSAWTKAVTMAGAVILVFLIALFFIFTSTLSYMAVLLWEDDLVIGTHYEWFIGWIFFAWGLLLIYE